MEVLSRHLASLNLPPGVQRGLRMMELITVEDLIDWIDKPDQYGRRGEMKLRSIRKVGPKKMEKVDQVLSEIGVDLSR